ncbi:glucans biosynthesis protein [Roseibium suaedae]|uniref:Glucans biosynthesis protein n=1 Tax=Roseibium suaedae TaxID=735517 RepID=A0A1M7FHF4_9HYPH|nr:glucans biosynthesis protein [Roseibium suaedae]
MGAALTFCAATAAGTICSPAALAQTGEAPAPAAPPQFSFDDLVNNARERAKGSYSEPVSNLPEAMNALDYDQLRAIRFRPDHSLWKDTDSSYEMQAFHPGGLFKQPVEVFEVVDGAVTPLHFKSSDFEYRAPLDPAQFDSVELPGVAGFRLHYPLNRPDYKDELIAFQGASYFRALGKDNIYGLSARGLSVNTAVSGPEEFPRFSRFFIERPAAGQQEIRLWADLDSPSVTGAYAFVITPGINTQIQVTARLFVRDAIERLGIAPLTSMYLFGENDRNGFDDYRPEVHDSDGLMILEKSGDRLWRPLRNPGKLGLSFFYEEGVKGFGLIQRDRSFTNYLDTEAQYQRRPSLWIETIDDWGAGQVMLAEIPSAKEIHDNVAAFWIPNRRAEAGEEFNFRYRMIWGREPEPGTDLALVTSTRTGHAGSAASDPEKGKRKFVVVFAGGGLETLGGDDPLEADLAVFNGKPENQFLQKVENGAWRLIFDVEREDGSRPVEMSLRLKINGKYLTEKWIYQWNSEA